MIVCDLCGSSAPNDEPPLTWVVSFEDNRAKHYCDSCTRENLRGIEGRLEPAWW
jgi:hypothetical protein